MIDRDDTDAETRGTTSPSTSIVMVRCQVIMRLSRTAGLGSMCSGWRWHPAGTAPDSIHGHGQRLDFVNDGAGLWLGN